MAEMLRKRGEMTNFQVRDYFILHAFLLHNYYYCEYIFFNVKVAGCTLDASAKIYAGRVDSIYNDACKMVGGLGRSDRHGENIKKLVI